MEDYREKYLEGFTEGFKRGVIETIREMLSTYSMNSLLKVGFTKEEITAAANNDPDLLPSEIEGAARSFGSAFLDASDIKEGDTYADSRNNS